MLVNDRAMANYFRWKKGKRDEDVFYSEKPRSRSLDPRSLELSGIRVFAQNHQSKQVRALFENCFSHISHKIYFIVISFIIIEV